MNKIKQTEMIPSQEQAGPSQEAIDQAVRDLGNAFHENWRRGRLNEDGTFEPRIKVTHDSGWIEARGTDRVDIANTVYDDLPEDWRAENQAAAEVIVNIFNEYNGNIDLNDQETRSRLGERVHAEWLSRNEWAKGSELEVPFAELSEAEQAKDLDQIAVAQQVFRS